MTKREQIELAILRWLQAPGKDEIGDLNIVELTDAILALFPAPAEAMGEEVATADDNHTKRIRND